MRLQSIKLTGFKTFVHTNSVQFDSNLTAIVGPNGCGKSNVIDAIRWVLGESSTKSLRTDNQTDVIFKGTENKKPVSFASVELFFDNSDNSLQGEFNAFNEISVKRFVARDGTSSYFINGEKCRRKDITDLFAGTGVGPKGYSIIEQGMISRLVEANPEQLRHYIEEAAGIAKYKDRRKETENKLSRTNENLNRLKDVLLELEKQKDVLEKQAIDAKRYQDLTNDYNQNNQRLATFRLQKINGEILKSQEFIHNKDESLQIYYTQKQEAEVKLENFKESLIILNNDFNQATAQFYENKSRIGQLENNIKQNSESLSSLQKQQTNITENENDLFSRLEQAEKQMQSFDLDTKEEETIKQLDAEIDDLKSKIQEETQQSIKINNEISSKLNENNNLQTKIAVLNTNINNLKQNIHNLNANEDLANAQILQNQQAEINDELIELKEEKLINEKKNSHLIEEINQNKEEITEINQQIYIASDKKTNIIGEIQKLNANISALEKLQQANENNENNFLNCLDVKKGYENYLETAFSDFLKAQIAHNITDAFNLALKNNSVLILEEKTYQGIHKDKLNSNLNLSPILDKIILAKDLLDAKDKLEFLQENEIIATQNGFLITKHFIKNTFNNEQGFLLRKKQLEEFYKDLDKQNNLLNDIQNNLSFLNDNLQAKTALINSYQQNNEQLTKNINSLQQQIAVLETKNNHLQKQIEELYKKQEQQREQLAELEEILNESVEENLIISKKITNNKEQLDNLQQQKQQISNFLQQQQTILENTTNQRNDLVLLEQSQKYKKASAIQEFNNLQERKEQFEQHKEILSSQIVEKKSILTKDEAILEELYALKEMINDNLTIKENKLKATQNEIKNLESFLLKSEREYKEQFLETDKAKQKLISLQAKREFMLENLQNSGFSLKAVDDLLNDTQISILPINENELDASLQIIKKQIEELGAVNLIAIKQFEQTVERFNFLSKQQQDLESSIATMQSVIIKIDIEMKNQFSNTFNKINQNLQKIFPQIFGGGNAYLSLTNEDSLIAGVSLMAQPLGKRNSTITLLSGGEKALTALALIFAIFQLNPAPFCILDEVDAPLDDANVGRYIEMVKKMSSNVQFIYITHNKIPMENAKQLIGVTMSEPGSSNFVSVNIEKALEFVQN